MKKESECLTCAYRHTQHGILYCIKKYAEVNQPVNSCDVKLRESEVQNRTVSQSGCSIIIRHYLDLMKWKKDQEKQGYLFTRFSWNPATGKLEFDYQYKSPIPLLWTIDKLKHTNP